MAPNQPISLPVATFTDPGQDTFTATIDWGDGSIEPGIINGLSVSGTHNYDRGGNYTVMVCVRDDDNGVGCDSFQVVYSANIYLPIMMNPTPCFAAGHEEEPNNSLAEANGLLCGNGTYIGEFDDINDFFSFQAGAGPIEIRLMDYFGQDAQVLLYYQSMDKLVGFGYYPNYSVQYLGMPGRYYIRVFVPAANNTPYSLKVIFH